MLLLDFLKKIFKPKENVVDYFLALEIREAGVKAVIWKNKNGKCEIIGIGKRETNYNWDEIIKNADEVITSAGKNIPTNLILKTIFSLPEDWVEEGKINKEILPHLKTLCSDLMLKPLGFIITTEAIFNYLQKKEGTPLTAILIGISKENTTISVIRVGKIQITKTLKNDSKQISDLLFQVIKELPEKEILPSRIILYSYGTDLEKSKEDLISFPWTQKASFLHFPKVEILAENTDIEAIVEIGNKELESRKMLKMPSEDEEREQIPNNQENNLSEKENLHQDESDTLGFISEKDILEEEVIPKNIQEEEVPEEIIVEEKVEDKRVLLEESQKRVEQKEKVNKQTITVHKLLGKIKNILSGIIPGKSFFAFLSIFFVIIFVGLFFAYWNLSKANMRIFVEPQVLENETTIRINPNTDKVAKESNEIPAIVLESEETVSQKKSTTGEKTIGEKAKGEVTLYNKTTSGVKTFKAGTIIIGPNDKEFTLDSDATIPVAASQQEGITFGKIKSMVTAMEIGEDSNFPEGKKEFSIKEFPASSYSAISDTAFKGGSSKKIKVVSKDDETTLSKDLEEKIKGQVKVKLESKLSTGQKLIPESMEKLSEKKIFTPEIGAESNEVTLEETAKYQVFAYRDSDLREILKKNIEKSISGDFEYNNSQIEIKVKDKKEIIADNKKKIIALTIDFKVDLIPKINKEEVKKTISGKNEEFVKEYLKSMPNVLGFEADVNPRLPKPFFLFPKNPKNITVTIIPKTN